MIASTVAKLQLTCSFRISTGEHTNETDKPQAQTAEPTGRSISFAADVKGYDKSKALYVPPPQERDRGKIVFQKMS